METITEKEVKDAGWLTGNYREPFMFYSKPGKEYEIVLLKRGREMKWRKQLKLRYRQKWYIWASPLISLTRADL